MFHRCISAPPHPPQTSEPVGSPTRRARALYDYDAAADDEMTIREGDIIDIVEDDGQWATGERDGKLGMFPISYVEFVPASGGPGGEQDVPEAKQSALRKARALHDYDATAADELSIREGDLIDIVQEDGDGWSVGVLNGQQGSFPTSYVEETEPKAKRQPAAAALTKKSQPPTNKPDSEQGLIVTDLSSESDSSGSDVEMVI